MRSDTARMLNVVQILSEVAILAGYALGMIPFVYLWSYTWVVPLVFVSLVLAIVASNGTTGKTIVNIAMAFLSFIPLVGYLFRVIGILVSILNIVALSKDRTRY